MMWNPLPATYLPNIDTESYWIRFIFPFTKECAFRVGKPKERKLIEQTHLAPIAKATMAEWLRVKKYFRPG